MMRHKIVLMLALLCAIAQGAWAQTSWEEVYQKTGTTSDKWTAINAGSTTGQTLGSAGSTTYCYAGGDLRFTNSNAGGSGLTIQGTVYLYVPQGVTLTCIGANANGQTGAGAGIELAAGNTLYLFGGGTVNAMGGNAANGGNGGNGNDAFLDGDKTILGGSGGNGGHGGGAGTLVKANAEQAAAIEEKLKNFNTNGNGYELIGIGEPNAPAGAKRYSGYDE